MNDTLATEMETYRARLGDLLAQKGKYVLISNSDVVDFFIAYEDALKAGYQRFGIKPFLVKKIEPVEQVQFFSRDLCPT